MANEAPSIGVHTEPAKSGRQHFNLLLIQWSEVVELPSLHFSEGHLGGSDVLESVLDFVGGLKHNEVPLDQVKLLHPVFLESHEEKIIVKLAKFSAFCVLLPCGVLL